MFHILAEYLKVAGWKDWTLLQLRNRSGLVWWVFAPDQDFPVVVAKLYQNPQAAERGRCEASALEHLQRAAAQLSIPTLLLQSESPAGFLLAQSGMPGTPWPDVGVSDQARWARQLEAADRWLADFQTHVGSSGSAADALAELITLCSQQIQDLTPEERELLRVGEECLPALRSVPGTPVHGDFWSGNVLDRNGRISVVDWSTFHYGGPTEDLYNFISAITYRRSSTRAQEAQKIWSAFFGDSPLVQAAASFTLRTLTRYRLGPELVRPLFVLFLIGRVARREFSNHAAWRALACRYVGAGTPAPLGMPLGA